MSQRVMIAMAIACNPKLLIADEPTTALDVTIQAQILDLLRSLQKDRGMALVLITHNMGVVSRNGAAHRRDVCGPDHGAAPAHTSLPNPQHPYTEALMAACRSAMMAIRAWPPYPAWCPGCTTGPTAACFRPAADTPMTAVPNPPAAAQLERWCRALPLPITGPRSTIGTGSQARRGQRMSSACA
jgi:dipeptide transport system ATP-binding protein